MPFGFDWAALWPSITEGLLAWLTEQAMAVFGAVLGYIDAETAPSLSAQWFRDNWTTVTSLGAVAAVLLTIPAAIAGAITRGARGAVSAMGRLAIIPVVGLTALPVLAFALAFADAATVAIAPDLAADAANVTNNITGYMSTGDPAMGVATWLLLMTLFGVASLIAVLQLVVRSDLIYLAALALPFIAGASVYNVGFTWLKRVVAFQLVCVLTKPAFAIGMSLVAAPVGVGSEASVGTALSSVAAMLVTICLPFLMLSLGSGGTRHVARASRAVAPTKMVRSVTQALSPTKLVENAQRDSANRRTAAVAAHLKARQPQRSGSGSTAMGAAGAPKPGGVSRETPRAAARTIARSKAQGLGFQRDGVPIDPAVATDTPFPRIPARPGDPMPMSPGGAREPHPSAYPAIPGGPGPETVPGPGTGTDVGEPRRAPVGSVPAGHNVAPPVAVPRVSDASGSSERLRPSLPIVAQPTLPIIAAAIRTADVSPETRARAFDAHAARFHREAAAADQRGDAAASESYRRQAHAAAELSRAATGLLPIAATVTESRGDS